MSDKGLPGRLQVQNKLNSLPCISEFVKSRLSELGFDDGTITEVQLAVDEACTNIIQNAYRPGQKGKIEISCEVLQGDLTITIKDDGNPFDPTAITASPDLESGLEDRQIGGLGIYFMRELMDDLIYRCFEKEGYETLTMVKHIQAV